MVPATLPADRIVGDFDRALPIILRSEGGYVNDPDDPGGETNFGITTRTYHAFLKRSSQEPRSVRSITEDEVKAIYWYSYWLSAQCDRLPWPLKLIHFDCAVNCGVSAATRQLQRALGLEADGIMGPITIARSAPAGPRECYRYLLERTFFYRSLVRRTPTAAKFLAGGWLGRIEDLYREIR